MPTRRALETETTLFDYDETKDFIINEMGVTYSSIATAIVALGLPAVAKAVAAQGAPVVGQALSILSVAMGAGAVAMMVEDYLYQQELLDALEKMEPGNWLMITSTSYEVYYSGGNHVTWDTEHSIAVI